jgi:hypothetical protein
MGELKFDITPRDGTIRQVNGRDFILVELLGVIGRLVYWGDLCVRVLRCDRVLGV